MGHVSSGPVSDNGQGSDLPGRQHRRSRPARDPDPVDPRAALGRLGEDLACCFLESHGITVASRNFILPIGEIDAVCVDRGTRVLVEVRASTSNMYPLDAIDRVKHDQLRRLANYVGIRRVDVIGVGVYATQVVFHWIPDAV